MLVGGFLHATELWEARQESNSGFLYVCSFCTHKFLRNLSTFLSEIPHAWRKSKEVFGDKPVLGPTRSQVQPDIDKEAKAAVGGTRSNGTAQFMCFSLDANSRPSGKSVLNEYQGTPLADLLQVAVQDSFRTPARKARNGNQLGTKVVSKISASLHGNP